MNIYSYISDSYQSNFELHFQKYFQKFSMLYPTTVITAVNFILLIEVSQILWHPSTILRQDSSNGNQTDQTMHLKIENEILELQIINVPLIPKLKFQFHTSVNTYLDDKTVLLRRNCCLEGLCSCNY